MSEKSKGGKPHGGKLLLVSVNVPSRIHSCKRLNFLELLLYTSFMGVVLSPCPIATGTSTLLHSFKIISTKGRSILVPRNRSRSAGVTKMPIMFPITALHRADATLPPAAVAKIIHILTVVGRHVMTRIPSRSGVGSKPGRIASKPFVTGRPSKRGQSAKFANCVSPLSFTFLIACDSSDSSSESPDNRKIQVTPYFPMKSSGRSKPPFLPNCWAKK